MLLHSAQNICPETFCLLGFCLLSWPGSTTPGLCPKPASLGGSAVRWWPSPPIHQARPSPTVSTCILRDADEPPVQDPNAPLPARSRAVPPALCPSLLVAQDNFMVCCFVPAFYFRMARSQLNVAEDTALVFL